MALTPALVLQEIRRAEARIEEIEDRIAYDSFDIETEPLWWRALFKEWTLRCRQVASLKHSLRRLRRRRHANSSAKSDTRQGGRV